MKIRALLFLTLLFSIFATALMADTADTIPFIMYMTQANEVPPTGVNANANAIVWVHVVRDTNNKITSGSVDFDVTYRFPGPTNITGLHIHNGPAGANAAIVIPTDVSATNPVVIDATGKGNIFKQVQFGTGDGQPPVSIIQQLLDTPQNFYINLHTTENPGGAIRAPMSKADMRVLLGLMSPANENPPIPNSNASAVTTMVTLRGTDQNGNFTTGAVIFDSNYTGFPAGTMFTGFHIHDGPAGVNGPVIINTGIGGGANAVPAGPTGSGNLHYTVFAAPDDATFNAELQTINDLFDNPNAHYVNIHTVPNPGGEIRSQVRNADVSTFQVNMLPSNEVPPITGLNANGVAKVSVYTIRNADASVAGGAVVFDVNHRGFPAGTTFTGLHIHDGTAIVAGPVTINTGLSGSNTVKSDTGNGNVYKIVTVDSGAALATLGTITQNPENAYINIHTTVNPGGAVRSQLAPANTALPAIGAVTSNPDSKTSTLAPGEIFTIFGANLAKFQSDLSGFYLLSALPGGLNGVTVTVGGIAAPIYFVSPLQINAQVPVNVAPGPQPVVVKTSNGSSTAFTATIATAAPAIYFDGGSGAGAILKNRDFSLVSASNPARAGDVVLIYLTGLGQTTPALQTGNLQPGTTFNNTGPVTVTIGGQPAGFVYSIASPGFAGLYQIAVTVPSGVTGNLDVVVKAGTATSNTVKMNVQ
jgi:uncharacterized protein (TIGR03437 family)